MEIVRLEVGLLSTNCYLLISDKNRCAIIDPGAGAHRIIEVIEEKRLYPQMILLTHGHYDHIGRASRLAEYFPCKIYAPLAEQEILGNAEQNLSKMLTGIACTCKADHWLKDGDIVQLDELQIRVIATPGHTPGSVSYLAEDALFSGDTLFRLGVGRTDLYGGDEQTLQNSVCRLSALPGNYRVLPGHGRETTLEWERISNSFLRKALTGNQKK